MSSRWHALRLIALSASVLQANARSTPGYINAGTASLMKEKDILPLVIDLSNPCPGLGWENRGRMSLAERGQGRSRSGSRRQV